MNQPSAVPSAPDETTARMPRYPTPEARRPPSRGPRRDHEAIPNDKCDGQITIGEIALFIVVVAFAQRILPRPLDMLAATSLPALYFPARIDPRLARPIGLSILLAILLAPFLLAWHSNEPADFQFGTIAALALSPLLGRIATWRCRSVEWDFLDPIVLATAPVGLASLLGVTSRLFELGIFSWE